MTTVTNGAEWISARALAETRRRDERVVVLDVRRREALPERSRPPARRRRLAVIALAVALAAALAAEAARAQEPTGPGRKMPDRGQKHVEQGTPISYEEYPPTSGPHWPVWARWGLYREAIPEEMFVHNLEHGGIVLLFNCSTPCPDVLRQLEELYPTLPPSKYGHIKVVVAPNSRIKRRFALLAWTRLDEFDRLDRERVVRFVRAWQDKGPEDIP